MDAYARRRTWPYITVVILLLVAAALGPRWWRSLDMRQRQQILAEIKRVEHLARRYWDRSTGDPVAPEEVKPQVAELNPRVAQRVIIEPTRPPYHGEPTEKIEWPSRASSQEIDTGAQADAETSINEATTDSSTRNSRFNITPPLDVTEFDLDQVSSAFPDGTTKNVATEPSSQWPQATELLAKLEQICSDVDEVEAWRSEAVDLLGQLPECHTLGHPGVAPILDQLDALSARLPMVERHLVETDRIVLRQVAYGIDRRTAIWRAVHALVLRDDATPEVVVSNTLPLLRDVEERLSPSENADMWAAYLMLDKLNQISTSTWVTDPSVRRATAREFLRRLVHPDLSDRQLRFINEPAVARLAGELRAWATTPVECDKLVQSIEQFEVSRTSRLASELVRYIEDLHWLDNPDSLTLAKAIDTHYRNANIRVAVAGRLVNDLLPVMEPIHEPVNDQILGASVRGRNRTWTRLRVRLVEDNRRIRLRFEAAGRTQSRTMSTKGPIRFFTRGASRFRAGKDVTLSNRGFRMADATATASGDSRMTNIQSDYDHIPLLGWVIRQMAIDELEDKRGQMKSVVNDRVTTSAKSRLDSSLQKKVDDVQARLNDRVFEPLRQLQLAPEPIEMRTTPERMVMRCRLASTDQLAAYTPRPRALSDSVLSMQLHESAANNLFQQLELDGETIKLEKLVERLAEKLQVDASDFNEEIPEGVVLRLGNERPLMIEFDADRILMTIRIAELSTPKKKWRNFVVRARYRADVERKYVDLEREGGIELISERLGFRDQIALRGIFTKVITRNHRLNIVRGRLAGDPRLADLAVTQFAVRDGWVGISVGPNRRNRLAQDEELDQR